MKQIPYLPAVIFLICFGCNKHDDNPADTSNIFEADIDGKHWKADSASAAFIPGGLTYGTNYFELTAKTADGQSFYITTKSDAPSEGQFEVIFLSLKAKFDLPANNGITLSWTTSQEKNADRYEIERSTDAITFTKAGEVKAINTAAETNYEWHEKPPFNNRYYYRLKAVNTTGNAYYSTVVVVYSGLREVYFSSGSDTAYHYGFNGTIALTGNDTTSHRLTGTFQFDYVDDNTGTRHTIRNGKFTNLAY